MNSTSSAPKKVSIIGGGSWGSTAACIVGRNVQKYAEFETDVRMWVYEEQVEGRNLSEIINETHENVKYLPGVTLPDNIIAVPDLRESVAGSEILIFVLPHQFLPRTCETIRDLITPNTIAISLIKGVDFDSAGAVLITDVIERMLEIDCSVLSGANIAAEIAAGKFCESTIGYNNPHNGFTFYKLFNELNFRISLIKDVVGPQVYGGLKNVIALGAGFCDALEMGNNTKSALMRIGLIEMQRFAQLYFKDRPVKPQSLVESCGVADLITTCMGGRNRRVAEAFGKAKGAETWETLEARLLNGQKLQGTSTCEEVHRLIQRDNNVEHFPFIDLIHRIAFEGKPVESIVNLPMPHIDSVMKAIF